MKYLKIYEDYNQDDIIQTCKDILTPINDIDSDIQIIIQKEKEIATSFYEKEYGKFNLLIKIGKVHKVWKFTHEIYSEIERVINYLKDENYDVIGIQLSNKRAANIKCFSINLNKLTGEELESIRLILKKND